LCFCGEVKSGKNCEEAGGEGDVRSSHRWGPV
jgi:hypothetical protein